MVPRVCGFGCELLCYSGLILAGSLCWRLKSVRWGYSLAFDFGRLEVLRIGRNLIFATGVLKSMLSVQDGDLIARLVVQNWGGGLFRGGCTGLLGFCRLVCFCSCVGMVWR